MELVALFNASGFITSGSCEGHVSRTSVGTPYIHVATPMVPFMMTNAQREAWWKTQRKRGTPGFRYREIFLALYGLLDEFGEHQARQHRSTSFGARLIVSQMGDTMRIRCAVEDGIDHFTVKRARAFAIEAQQNFQDLAAFMLKRFLAPTARH